MACWPARAISCSAQLIYRDEAEFLLSGRPPSSSRRHLPGVRRLRCLGRRRTIGSPTTHRALEFYLNALEPSARRRPWPEIELLVAECQQHLDRTRRRGLALREVRRGPPPTARWTSKPVIAWASAARRNATGKEARRTWQDLLARSMPKRRRRESPRRPFQLAADLGSSAPADRRGPGSGRGRIGIVSYDDFPLHKLAGQAHLTIAQSYLHRGRYDDAVAHPWPFPGRSALPRTARRSPTRRNLLGQSLPVAEEVPRGPGRPGATSSVKHPAHKAWTRCSRKSSTPNTSWVEKNQGQRLRAGRKLRAEFTVKYPLDGRDPGIPLPFRPR